VEASATAEWQALETLEFESDFCAKKREIHEPESRGLEIGDRLLIDSRQVLQLNKVHPPLS
jgi:hypothetical protein